MRRLSTLLLAMMTALSTGAGPVRASGEGAGVIVMFGARWCAPCMVEYRELPGLVAAAAPDRIALAWVDRSIAPPAGTEIGVRSMTEVEARRLAHDLAGDGYGLPFSVLFDGSGRACAMWRAPLRIGDLATLRTQCDQSRA